MHIIDVPENNLYQLATYVQRHQEKYDAIETSRGLAVLVAEEDQTN